MGEMYASSNCWGGHYGSIHGRVIVMGSYSYTLALDVVKCGSVAVVWCSVCVIVTAALSSSGSK